MNLGAFQDRRSSLFRDSIRSGWVIIILAILAGGAAGGAFAVLRPATYSASTTVLVSQIIGNPYTPTSNTDVLEMLQTEAAAVTSDGVLQAVLDDINLPSLTLSRLRARTVVTVPANTQTLRITYASNNPQLAPEIVNAIATEYLAQRQQSAEAAKERLRVLIQRQIDEDRTKIQEARDTNAGKAVIDGLVSDRLALVTQLAVTQASEVYPGEQLALATKAQGSKSAHLILFTVAGVLLGLVAGFSLALWRERRRDLVRSPADLEDYDLDAPITAVDGELSDEVLRGIRLRLSPQIREHALVAVAGVLPGQAIRTGVLIAHSVSQRDTSVLLIDGTGTERGHKDLVTRGNNPGLSELLAGTLDPAAVVSISDHCSYLPAGKAPEEAVERLVEDRTRIALYDLAEQYDLTLVATMPLSTPEGEALARHAEGILLMVERDRTTHYDLGVALKTIASQKHRLIGVFVLPARR